MTFISLDEWKKYGVFVDQIDYDILDRPSKLYISVPETSDMIDGKGNEMSGKLLARRVKRSLGCDCEVVYAIRTEHWKNTKGTSVLPHEQPVLADSGKPMDASNAIKNVLSIFFGFGNEFAR